MTYTELGGNSIEITLRVQIKILSNRRDSPAAQVCLLKDLFGGLFYFGFNIPYLLSKLYLFFVSLSTMLNKLDDGHLSDVTAIYEAE